MIRKAKPTFIRNASGSQIQAPFFLGQPAMKLLLTSLLLLLCLAPLSALIGEYSASANALNGITMLSQSVADHAISPIVFANGVVFSRHSPFGLGETTYYGWHNAVPTGLMQVSTGINYLAHPDYRWQDQYLSLRLGGTAFALGATQHLFYEKIGDKSWYTWDNDLALSFMQDGYGTEIRWLHLRGKDTALVLSAQTAFSDDSSLCSSYTYREDGPDCYGVASSYEIAEVLLLQTSWQSEPARFGIGCKFIIGTFELMYSLRTHPELDLTHSIDIGSLW